MASQLLESTTKGADFNADFDFDTWIVQNNLTEIKDYFIKYNMTTIFSLNSQSNEFSKFIADTSLLTTKNQFIPKVFKAIQNLQNKNKINQSRVVIISQQENLVFDTIKSNLKQLNDAKKELNLLKQQSIQSQLLLQQTRDNQIQKAKKSVQDTIDESITALKAKKQQLLDRLDALNTPEQNDMKYNDIDDMKYDDKKYDDPIFNYASMILQDTQKMLNEKLKKCNDYIHDPKYNDIKQRQIILSNIVDTMDFDMKYLSLATKISQIKEKINYNNTLSNQKLVDFNVNQQQCAALMNSIEKLGQIELNDIIPLPTSSTTQINNRALKRLWKEMTKDKYNTMMNWLTKNGAKLNNCKVKQLNGIYVTSITPRFKTLVSIPNKCMMTMELAKQSVIGRKLQQHSNHIGSDQTFLAVYLLVERNKGTKSFWHPYINMLPKEFRTIPFYFTEKEKNQLKGSFSLIKAKNKILSYQKQYNAIKSILTLENISFHDFVRARTIAITRIFGVRINDVKTSALVPFADMIDHGPPSSNRVKWTYNSDDSSFVVTANSTLQPGSELFVTYGTKCNSRFFVNYGMALEQNSKNQARIYLNICEIITNKNQLNLKKNDLLQSLLRKMDIKGYDVKFAVNKEYGECDSFELFGMARLMSCDENEWTAIENETDLKDIGFISTGNEKKAIKLISNAAEYALNQFDTLLIEDNILLKDKLSYPINSNKRNIVLMRRGEKQVLVIYAKLYEQLLNNGVGIQLDGYTCGQWWAKPRNNSVILDDYGRITFFAKK